LCRSPGRISLSLFCLDKKNEYSALREEPDDQSGGFMASALLFLNLTAADRAGGKSNNDSKAVDKGSMWILSNSGK
jgi:hypothetical protein